MAKYSPINIDFGQDRASGRAGGLTIPEIGKGMVDGMYNLVRIKMAQEEQNEKRLLTTSALLNETTQKVFTNPNLYKKYNELLASRNITPEVLGQLDFSNKHDSGYIIQELNKMKFDPENAKIMAAETIYAHNTKIIQSQPMSIWGSNASLMFSKMNEAFNSDQLDMDKMMGFNAYDFIYTDPFENIKDYAENAFTPKVVVEETIDPLNPDAPAMTVLSKKYELNKENVNAVAQQISSPKNIKQLKIFQEQDPNFLKGVDLNNLQDPNTITALEGLATSKLKTYSKQNEIVNISNWDPKSKADTTRAINDADISTKTKEFVINSAELQNKILKADANFAWDKAQNELDTLKENLRHIKEMNPAEYQKLTDYNALQSLREAEMRLGLKHTQSQIDKNNADAAATRTGDGDDYSAFSAKSNDPYYLYSAKHAKFTVTGNNTTWNGYTSLDKQNRIIPEGFMNMDGTTAVIEAAALLGKLSTNDLFSIKITQYNTPGNKTTHPVNRNGIAQTKTLIENKDDLKIFTENAKKRYGINYDEKTGQLYMLQDKNRITIGTVGQGTWKVGKAGNSATLFEVNLNVTNGIMLDNYLKEIDTDGKVKNYINSKQSSGPPNMVTSFPHRAPKK